MAAISPLCRQEFTFVRLQVYLYSKEHYKLKLNLGSLWCVNSHYNCNQFTAQSSGTAVCCLSETFKNSTLSPHRKPQFHLRLQLQKVGMSTPNRVLTIH